MLSPRELSQLVLIYLSLYTTAKSASRQPSLRFGSDGTFKLVVFADLHFGERDSESWAQWGEDQVDVHDTATKSGAEERAPGSEQHESDGARAGRREARLRARFSIRLLTRMLRLHIDPFSVFGGDMVTGENLWRTNASEYLSLAIAPTAARNIPFATIFGNHDNSINITHPALYFHEQKHYAHLSRTRETADSATDQAGRFNYYTEVFANTEDSVPSVILWFFDSRSGIFDDPTQYEDWVDAKTAYVSFGSLRRRAAKISTERPSHCEPTVGAENRL